MIEISNLSFSYKKNKVLNNISFGIPSGKITSLVGSNGSGKTTLFNLIVGLLKPCDGNINIYKDNSNNLATAKDYGIVFQTTTSDERLTVYENLLLHSSLYSIEKSKIEDAINKYLELFKITSVKNELVKKLSGGNKRKIDIVRSLLHSPRYLFYDEPFVHIDVETKNEIWNILKKEVAENNLTLLFSTHSLQEVENSENIIVINKGEILYNDKKEEFQKYLSYKLITLTNNYYKKYKNLFDEDNFTKVIETTGQVKLKVSNINYLKELLNHNDELLNIITIENPEIEDIYLAHFSNNKN